MMPPELLAPAGSPEALQAAVRNGADAVYLAFGDLNARRGAKNFSDDEFKEAVQSCHLRGVRVYLTLNILVTDRELPRAVETARFAAACGVDAIIVQDLGLVRMLRVCLPALPLHASTQMTIHNLPGLLFCQEQGLQQVVLARELTRADLQQLCASSPLPLEVFAHGALCMCYSGQCYLSALIGERSGNRGLCAQPCRLAFRREGDERPSYPLSLKDLSLADHLDELTEMGIASLKLEGRMKRPEYVALVTGIYRQLLDEKRQPTPEESDHLEQAFSREGFTQGYYLAEKDHTMFGRRKEGESMSDPLLTLARQRFRGKEVPTIPLQMAFRLTKNEPSSLDVTDADGHRYIAYGDIPVPVDNHPLTEDKCREQLAKLGGTPFYLDHLTVSVDEHQYIPLSAINALRREAVQAITDLRTQIPTQTHIPLPSVTRVKGPKHPPVLQLSLTRASQLSTELLNLSPALVSLPLMEWAAHADTLQTLFAAYPHILQAVQLPRIVRDAEYLALEDALSRCRAAGVTEAFVGTWGLLQACRDFGFQLRGDFGLGVYNSYTMEALHDLGFVSATVSFELNFAQIRDLSKPIATEALVYGRLPLMLTEHCLLHPNSKPCASCGERSCPHEGNTLTDRRGEVFPILPTFGGRSELYNAKTLYLADKREDFVHIGLHAVRLLFTTEQASDCVSVLRAYQNKHTTVPPADFTRGLYYRRVE